MDEKIDGVLRWFGYVKRMENNRIAKRVYVGECTDRRRNRKMVHDGNVRRGLVRDNAWDVARGMNPWP